MLPNFVLADGVRREDGASEAVPLGAAGGKLLIVTLGVTSIIEQESLDVSLWGSRDGLDWGAAPLAAFPQKFYCGTYTIVLDLSEAPEIGWLRVQWKMGRWGRGEPTPLFGFYVFAQESQVRTLANAGS